MPFRVCVSREAGTRCIALGLDHLQRSVGEKSDLAYDVEAFTAKASSLHSNQQVINHLALTQCCAVLC